MGIFSIFNRKKSVEVRNLQEPESSAESLLFGLSLGGEPSTSLSAFFGAMELISNSIAQIPIRVKRNGEIDTNHPINFIFKNGLITKFTLMKQLISDVIKYGNGVCYINRANDGTPISLVYCEHGSYTIHYRQTKQELYYLIPFVRKGQIEPIDVIHLYKDSNDGVNGRSIVSYANTVLTLAKATDKTARKYYASGCAIQGALSIKSARKDAKKQAKSAWLEAHGDNGNGLIILDDEMSYSPISSNATDSQMLEARAYNVQEIARYFNINPILLGDKDGCAYKSIEEANVEFVVHTLMPYITMIEEEFNRKLVKPSETNKISVDLDEKFLIKGDTKTTSEYLTTLVEKGIMSINEARYQLGLKPIKGGDDCIIPYSNVTTNKVGNDNPDDNKKDEKEDNDE